MTGVPDAAAMCMGAESFATTKAQEDIASASSGIPAAGQSGSVLVIAPNTQHILRNIGTDHLVQLSVLGAVTPRTGRIEAKGGVATPSRNV